MRMVDMPLEFGGQGRTYLYKLVCIPAGALFFFFVEYILMILPRLLRVCKQLITSILIKISCVIYA